jgi:acetyl-CoA C-acetyltransferase
MAWTAWKTPTSAARPWACSPKTASRSTASPASAGQFAIASTTCSAPRQPTRDGSFDWEMAPVTVKGRARPATVIAIDEALQGQARQDPGLKPAFKKDGTITAANQQHLNDGAAALVLMRESTARASWAARRWRASSAMPCTRRRPSGSPPRRPGHHAKALAKAGWDAKSVDLWEVNEAFAAVPWRDEGARICRTRSSTCNGGACALGHPIGASGARIVVTLLGALKARPQARRGDAVHRRRRGHRAGAGTAVILIANCGHSTGWSCFYSNIHP